MHHDQEKEDLRTPVPLPVKRAWYCLEILFKNGGLLPPDPMRRFYQFLMAGMAWNHWPGSCGICIILLKITFLRPVVLCGSNYAINLRVA